MQVNEDVEDEVVADVIWSAMIDEGNDCNDNRLRGKSRSLYGLENLSTGGRQEPNAISSGALEKYTAHCCDV